MNISILYHFQGITTYTVNVIAFDLEKSICKYIVLIACSVLRGIRLIAGFPIVN